MAYDAFADFRMDGHVAIVTGGAQNIGAGIARTFSGAGAKVVIADLDGEKAADTAHSITTDTGGEMLGLGCDVTNDEDIDRVVAHTAESFGGISTLVNNVGWGRAYDDPLAIPVEDMLESYSSTACQRYG